MSIDTLTSCRSGLAEVARLRRRRVHHSGARRDLVVFGNSTDPGGACLFLYHGRMATVRHRREAGRFRRHRLTGLYVGLTRLRVGPTYINGTFSNFSHMTNTLRSALR